MDQNKTCRITPNGKKLKQAQLFFKKTECDSKSSENHNKRKLDIPFDDSEVQLIKMSRLEDNLNVNDDVNVKPEHNLDESENEKFVKISILLTPYQIHNEDEKKCNNDIAAVDQIHDVSKTDLIDKSLNSSLEHVNESYEVSDVDTDGKSSEITSPSSDASKTPNVQNKDDKIKKLTAKQIGRREELENRKKEKLKLKQEKDKMRAEKKQKRLSLKMERDELQRKKREEKEKKRLVELELKNEEKRLKEEEKRLKDEEKKAKEEEKKAKEEEKRAKEEERKAKEDREKRAQEKLSSSFTKFFVPKNKPTDSLIAADKQVEKDFATPRFMPFEVKENMYIAPIHRRRLDDDNKKILENSINLFANLENLYLNELKLNNIVLRSAGNTWNLKDSERLCTDGVSAELKQEENGLDIPPFNNIARKRYRAKLLQFEENRRPAYWGTWRKHSSLISGRCPFRHDKDLIDYDIDSDEEWEDEEPGESLHDSDEEKEPMDDYEVDNDVFVPHGYLSDEECADDQHMSPTAQKMKLDLLNEQFNAELMEQTKRLQVKFFGCIWISNNKESEEGIDAIENLLLSFRAVYNKNEVPFKVPDALQSSVITSAGNTPINTAKGNIKAQFPDIYLADLVSILHGHQRKAKIIAKEFNEFLTNKSLPLLPFSCITRKIKEISAWKNKNWCVHDEIRNKYPSEQTKPTDDEINETILLTQQCVQTAGPTPPSKSLITKFTKILTPEEKQKQLESLTNEKSVPVELKNCDSVTKPKNTNNINTDVLKHHTKQTSMPHTSNSTNLITKFTKVLTPEERAKNLESFNNKRSIDKETTGENSEKIDFENVANVVLPPTIEETNKSGNDDCSLSPCRSPASQCSTSVTNSSGTPNQSETPKRRRITPIFISKIENIKSLSN